MADEGLCSEMELQQLRRTVELSKLAKGQITQSPGNPEHVIDNSEELAVHNNLINSVERQSQQVKDQGLLSPGQGLGGSVVQMVQAAQKEAQERDIRQLEVLSCIANSLQQMKEKFGDHSSADSVTGSKVGGDQTAPDVDDLFQGSGSTTMNGDGDTMTTDPFLMELQQLCQEEVKFGPEVNDKLAEVVKYAISHPLKDEQLSSLNDTHLVPQNCQEIRVPKVNKELWSAFRNTRGPDLALQHAQKSMCLGLIPLVKAMDILIKKGDAKQVQDLVKDSFRALAHGLHTTNLKRRAMVKTSVPTKYQKVTEDNTPVTEFLFGDDLDQRVDELEKEKRRVQKLSNDSFLGQRYSKEYKPSHRFNARVPPKGNHWGGQLQKWSRVKMNNRQMRGQPYQRK